MADDPNAVADATAPDPAPVAPAPPPQASIVTDKAAAITAAVLLWQVNVLGNSPVSRDSEAWAHVTESLPALIDYILQET